ncbi:FAD:protein FMN transferase [Colwellia psychrerythraea]|uniref:FAD:protein FMN transferase n=1 Tax=Colwellia psychrerythraea (strain 34H / ATCC BAA-681) TaxID=167879 RepID=Q480M0_COLP3|nr:FAD:protein FMN transferase [Colwellia psychrerythraea]AAZ24503.1 apbE family protein [Colwellia psychrerythraea 34H]
MKKKRTLKYSNQQDSHSISFNAMASPCEVIVQSQNKRLAEQVAQCVSREVWRIEDKYSRYDSKSVCSQINSNAGNRIAIDEETFLLLNFAEQCYQLSDGLFDISSGVLRKVWSFDSLSGECQHFPSATEVNKLLSFVGWNKVDYDQQSITLPQNMELDFGGIGKEYAVDRSILLAKKITDEPILVNLGGDLAVTGPRLNDQAWQVAIEHPDSDVLGQPQDMIVALNKGALATSGDARRYLIKEGIRYGHVLNATTGWPIINAPRSITTVAPQCIQAGILATLALLQGEHAEHFLTEQDITFWARR